MRQQQKAPKDTSHIAVDHNSMHKKPDVVAHEAAAGEHYFVSFFSFNVFQYKDVLLRLF
jgi:hypothetical protein